MPAYKRSAAKVPAPLPAGKILYRAEEAAKIMSLSRTAVFGLIRSDDLDTIKIGNLRRIPHTSIEDYVRRQLTAGTDDVQLVS